MENSGKSWERDVIRSQIDICKHHLAQYPDLALVDTYVDNGCTGTAFHRPAFSRLMADIQRGSIRCLIVRDLSRFGRDYVEAGVYLEQIFPALGLRFLSVKEGYDSDDTQNVGAPSLIALQNMVNALYSKDISQKVATAHRTRMLTGVFRRSTLPYGYRLDETRTQVLVDDQAAPFVQLLFAWKLQGVSVGDMAMRLDQWQAPTPKLRKHETGVSRCAHPPKSGWHGSTIQNLLQNPAYLGSTVLGRTLRALYRGLPRQTPQSPDRWYVLENTHPPLVTPQVFFQVQALFDQAAKKRSLALSRTEEAREAVVDLFQGKVFCAD